MDWMGFFISFATSGVVATIIGKTIEIRNKKKMEKLRHEYNQEIEKLKADITIKKEIEEFIAQKRLQVYPKIVSTVYRIRNIAREFVTGTKITENKIDEIENYNTILIEYIISNRLLLQRDKIFDPPHQYKKHTILFIQLLRDLQFYEKKNNDKEINLINSKLKTQFEVIDTEYDKIIKIFEEAEKIVA
ncbi:MAG: hypothetical protein GF353_01530 [Candidatus Lokiarchaeota archaeon]|nr:hypothetical protein [Candidatus Lokiarchaeota archaeon]